MNIGSILKKVGAAVIRDVVPGGGLVVDLVNSFLPDEKKLPETATGSQANDAISSLPAEQQIAILSKQLDVEMAEISGWSQVVESLARADESGASTRPQIALMQSKVVAFAVVTAITTWAIAILTGKVELLKNLNDSWVLVVGILATPTALLNSYFGKRSDEKKARYSVATGGGVKPGAVASVIAGIFQKR